MKVKAIDTIGSDRRDNRGSYEIEIDGKKHFDIADGEPEDMTLGRDLSGVYSIPDMLKLAHEAGLRGESLEIERVQVQEE